MHVNTPNMFLRASFFNAQQLPPVKVLGKVCALPGWDVLQAALLTTVALKTFMSRWAEDQAAL